MKNRNIFPIILITALLAISGCKNQTNTDYKTENIDTKPPGGITNNEPSTIQEDLKQKTSDVEKKYSTGNNEIKLVDYQKEEQNYNTQDKRMIIRSGSLSIEAEKYDETESKIKQIVTGFNGYITNTSATLNVSGKKQGTITVRVASDKFDNVIAELSKIGRVMNENITGNDVTEEYMDSEARLKTQQELESRLLKLLQEKTASLTNVVEVEQKLASVRENIERTQGRMKYLKDQASWSTLAVSVYEPALLQTSTGGGFFYELGQSVKKGLNGFTAVLSGIITIVIALTPIVTIMLIIAYFIRKYFKKRKLVKA